MSFLGNLGSVFATIDSSEYIDPPPANLFYETMPLPSGPGSTRLLEILSSLPKLDNREGPWIAGGAARRLLRGEDIDVGDVDLFFKSHASWKMFQDALKDEKLIVETQKASTYEVKGVKVQIIKRSFYGSLEQVFKDFDFSVCQVATDGTHVTCTKQAHLDIMDQVLRLAPGGRIAKHTLVQRLAKYVNHGLLPEPGLFELVIKSGLDYVNAYQIFKNEDVAVYDHSEGECVEEMLPVSDVDDGVMRTIARRLNLEIPRVSE